MTTEVSGPNGEGRNGRARMTERDPDPEILECNGTVLPMCVE